MPNILVIKSSAAGKDSLSGALADHAVRALAAGRDDVTQVERDLDREPIAYIRSGTLAGIGRPGVETEEAAGARLLSDTLIAEVDAADIVVIAAPMYNFSMTATLKSWFDHVIRAGLTFSYTPTGPVGLLKPKPFLVIETRGGIYSEGANMAADAQEPLFRALLRFIGMTDVHFVRGEGVAMKGREPVMAQAVRQIDAIVGGLRQPAVADADG